jgi:hypothetical protein
MTNAPISLIERSKNVQDPDTHTWRTIRYLEASCRRHGCLQRGDRIRDDRTGTMYAISSATRVPRSLAGQRAIGSSWLSRRNPRPPPTRRSAPPNDETDKGYAMSQHAPQAAHHPCR